MTSLESYLRILLLDAGWNQTAYLVAELARAGIDATVFSPRVPDLGRLSPYCTHITSPYISDERYQAAVLQAIQTQPADIVLPLCERILEIVWSFEEKLQEKVFPRTTAQQRNLLTNRQRLYDYATALDIPVPQDYAINGETGLREVIRSLGTPLVLRGTQGMSGEQVRIVSDESSAMAAFRELEAVSPDPPFAQEFLDGRRCLIGGLFDHGHPLQWFSQCTIESYPGPTGPSIRVRSLRDATLSAYAERLFGSIGWDGVACAEFIQLKSGGFRFLEINPRPWAAIRAADNCGVAMLRLFADYLQGKKPASVKNFRDGVDCTLFPAFMFARIHSGTLFSLSDWRAYLQMMTAVPWTRPSLVAHFARMLVWSASDASRKAVKAPKAPKASSPSTGTS